jgi:hypothetical protein
MEQIQHTGDGYFWQVFVSKVMTVILVNPVVRYRSNQLHSTWLSLNNRKFHLRFRNFYLRKKSVKVGTEVSSRTLCWVRCVSPLSLSHFRRLILILPTNVRAYPQSAFHPYFVSVFSFRRFCDLFLQYRTSLFNRSNNRPDPVGQWTVQVLQQLIAYSLKTLITNKCTERVLSSIVTHSYMFRPCWVIFRENFLLQSH